MNIKEAKLCGNCNEVYSGRLCPKCGTNEFIWLNVYLMSPEMRQKYLSEIYGREVMSV